MKLTPAIIRAAAQDAGNAAMRKASRKAWSEDDFNAASETFARLSALMAEG